jgi:phage terminase large subunit-like protein
MGHRRVSSYQKNKYVKLAFQYAEDLISGKIVAAKITVKSAERFLRDNAHQQSDEFPYRLDVEAANSVFVQQHVMMVNSTGSVFRPLATEGNVNDGLNIHMAVVDELHAHPTRELYDVLATGVSKRNQSLLWVITTAGSNISGICYEQQTYVVNLLDQVAADETYFGIIFTIDEGDDWFDEAIWPKANPNYRISVFEDSLQSLTTKAKVLPASQSAFRTKHLNQWVQSASPLFSLQDWLGLGDPTLKIEDFIGEDCTLGIDLADRNDITAVVRLFWKKIDGEWHYYCFPTNYLPEIAIQDSRNSSYWGWQQDGQFKVTSGNVTDFSVIEDDVLTDYRRFNVTAASFDPWQSSYLVQRLMAEGVPMLEYRQSTGNLSAATKELQALILQGRIHHDGGDCMSWQISNCTGKYDFAENVKPIKEQKPNKIDAAVVLIMTLGARLQQELETDGNFRWISF